MDVTTLTLPHRTHAAVLTGRDVVTGAMLAYPVVWADRTYTTCPRCGELLAQEINNCPVMLDTGSGQGGQLAEFSQQHGCGEWLAVDWAEVQGVDPTEDDVLAAAHLLAAGVASEINTAREAMRTRLARELSDALGRLQEPLADWEDTGSRELEVTSGSDMDPGVFLDYTGWCAWDYDPDGSGDPVTVTADDLAASRG